MENYQTALHRAVSSEQNRRLEQDETQSLVPTDSQLLPLNPTDTETKTKHQNQ